MSAEYDARRFALRKRESKAKGGEREVLERGSFLRGSEQLRFDLHLGRRASIVDDQKSARRFLRRSASSLSLLSPPTHQGWASDCWLNLFVGVDAIVIVGAAVIGFVFGDDVDGVEQA